MAAVLMLLKRFVSVAVGVLAKAFLSEELIIGLMIKFGDWLVEKTKATLDNEAWKPIREQLEKQLKALQS